MLFNRNNNNNGPCLVVLHIPKTAGTTLRYIINRHYRKKEVFEIYDKQRKFKHRDDLKRLDEKKKSRLSVVIGHFGMNLQEYFPQPFSCITMLRDPVELVLSTYTHVMNLNDRWRNNPISFEEFISKKNVNINNRQSRMISGMVTGVGFGQCDESMLTMALENIENKFLMVGISEMFDESIFALADLCGWDEPFYVKENVSKNRKKRLELSADIIDRVRELNRLDIELYERMKTAFSDNWVQRDAHFHERFDAFVAKNAEYSAKHKPKVVWG